MKKSRKYRILIIIAAVLICLVAALIIYRSSITDLLNRTDYTALYREISDAASEGRFESQQDLASYITAWADGISAEYETDQSGNIIITAEASPRKKNLSPTVICVSYNYETASQDARLLASAAMIARTDLRSGRRTVIFVNDEHNSGDGYRHLSSKYFKDNAKVIYMDYGSSSYMSSSSFRKKYQTITVKSSRTEPECDTAIRVHITGLDPARIDAGISKRPDVIGALSTLLSRLKSKSSIYQLADLQIGSDGSMYPVSMDATIMLNSYAVASFTKYLDKRIKAWDKSYGSDYADLSYTYEVIDDPEQLPESAYTRKSTERLTNVLYMLHSGLYRYEDNDNIPEESEVGDIYGIDAIINLRPEDNAIYIDMMAQASGEETMQILTEDHTAAAELFSCSISDLSDVPEFFNGRDSMSRTFKSTYFKINGIFNLSDVIMEKSDNYFTPCSYLASKNSDADIIHIHLSSDKAAKLTNTILCYIAYKGNILF